MSFNESQMSPVWLKTSYPQDTNVDIKAFKLKTGPSTWEDPAFLMH